MRNILALISICLFSAFVFASASAGVGVSNLQVRCLGWDLDADTGDGSCVFLHASAEISNGISSQILDGELLSSGNYADDAAVLRTLCGQQGYKNVKTFLVEPYGNAYLKGFFELSPDLSLKRLVKRKTPEQIIGPVLKEFTCTLK